MIDHKQFNEKDYIMSKKLATIVTILLVTMAFFCLFPIGETKSSSVSDNVSTGITLKSVARVMQTECINASGFRLPTTNPAALTDLGLGGSMLVFADETADYDNARMAVKVPKDIDSTVQPYIQLDWSCDAATDDVNVRWEVTYLWIGADETSDATSDAVVTGDYTISDVTKGLVESDIQLANFLYTDKFLYVNIARRSDATQDTSDGQNANIFGACLYYTKDKLGEPL